VEEFDLAMLDAEVRRRAVSEELIAVGDEMIVHRCQVFHRGARICLVLRSRQALDARPGAGPFQTPFEGPDDAVAVA